MVRCAIGPHADGGLCAWRRGNVGDEGERTLAIGGVDFILQLVGERSGDRIGTICCVDAGRQRSADVGGRINVVERRVLRQVWLDGCQRCCDAAVGDELFDLRVVEPAFALGPNGVGGDGLKVPALHIGGEGAEFDALIVEVEAAIDCGLKLS